MKTETLVVTYLSPRRYSGDLHTKQHYITVLRGEDWTDEAGRVMEHGMMVRRDTNTLAFVPPAAIIEMRGETVDEA